MLDLAKSLLGDGDCTLVVVNGCARKFFNRGVRDWLALYDDPEHFALGASVADKIVGKAAAALMIESGVKEVYTPKITGDARRMLDDAGVAVQYDLEIEQVDNRAHTGRCPIDTICAPLTDRIEMITAIRNFLNNQNK